MTEHNHLQHHDIQHINRQRSSTMSYQSNQPRKRFIRSTDDRMIAGVCRGIADYLNMDPTLVRVVFALLTIFSLGIFGVIAYVALIFVMPEADGSTAGPQWKRQPSAEPGPAPWTPVDHTSPTTGAGFGAAAGEYGGDTDVEPPLRSEDADRAATGTAGTGCDDDSAFGGSVGDETPAADGTTAASSDDTSGDDTKGDARNDDDEDRTTRL